MAENKIIMKQTTKITVSVFGDWKGWSLRWFLPFFVLCLLLSCSSSKQKTLDRHLLVFLHGYSGNQNNMLSLKDKLSKSYDTISILGFYKLSKNRYSWGSIVYNENDNTWFDKKSTLHSVFKLREILKKENREIIIVGESQGGSVGYALTLNYPDKFKTLVAVNSYIDHNLLLNKDHNYNKTQIYRLNSDQDLLINSRMVNKSSSLLDSLGIEHTIFKHNKGHELGLEEEQEIINWIKTITDEKNKP